MLRRGKKTPSTLVPNHFNLLRLLTELYSQAAEYGKCIVADYNAIHKDMCAKEFLKLKNCYLVCLNNFNST